MLLPPITITVAILRVDIVYTTAVLWTYGVIMMIVWLQVADLPFPINMAVGSSSLIGMLLSVGLQLPLWWLVRMMVHGEKRILVP